MRKYIAKRVFWAVITLFLVMFLIYVLMNALPTSYIERVARERSAADPTVSAAEWVAKLEEIYALDDNLLVGYVKWLGQFFRGNFGDSWLWGVPVTQKFQEVVWYSVALSAVSGVLQVVIAIPLGITAARKQYSPTDYAITFFALIGISLPTFFFATVLQYVFSIKLGWFELFGMVSRNHYNLSSFGRFLDLSWHFVLPVLTLTIISVGSLMRYTRTNMLEVLSSDYIRTARAKGVSEKRVVNHHAFRNTLIPLVTIFSQTLAGFFSGAMITETLFQISGIGYVSYQSMIAGDIPFTMFYLAFMSILTLLGNLLGDIMYAVVDPRVRVS